MGTNCHALRRLQFDVCNFDVQDNNNQGRKRQTTNIHEIHCAHQFRKSLSPRTYLRKQLDLF